MPNKNYIGLDIGSKRIGVAISKGDVSIAYPLLTINVDGTENEKITEIVKKENIDVVVVGYPRNQNGESTEQTEFTEKFIDKIKIDLPEIVYQDESMTSVLAEEALKLSGKPYVKSDIDSKAAAIILQDYLETQNG